MVKMDLVKYLIFTWFVRLEVKQVRFLPLISVIPSCHQCLQIISHSIVLYLHSAKHATY